MGKRSAAEIALDQIDTEMVNLQRVRDRLVEAMGGVKPKRERKPKAVAQPREVKAANG